MEEYNLFYINLNAREDRKQLIEEEFKKLQNKKYKFKPTRIDACYHVEGAIGVAESHIKALKLAKKLNLNQVMIAEDDLFIKEELVDKYFDIINNFKKKWDVIILSGWFCPLFDEIEEKINDNMTKCKATQTCTWYLIKKSYYNTLIDCFTESKNNLIENSANILNIFADTNNDEKKEIHKQIVKEGIIRTWAIDINWKKLQKKDNWYRFNINLGYQRPDYSNIENRNVDYTYLLN